MPEYVYHFDDSAMKRFSENFESRIGDNSGYHEQEHLEVLHMLMSMARHGSCLDVGAGMGRITSVARNIVAELVALEPDESRWKDCHSAYHSEPSCLVLNQTTGEYIRDHPEKQFDLVIVSMVLQHLSTGNCDQLVAEVNALLKPNGVAVIFTTHTLEQCKGFSFSSDNTRAFVPQEEFDTYADSPPSEQNLGLPVRRFSKQDLMTTVERAGLDPIYWRQTSYYRPERVGFFAHRLQVSPEDLRFVGNSQFVIVQKAV